MQKLGNAKIPKTPDCVGSSRKGRCAKSRRVPEHNEVLAVSMARLNSYSIPRRWDTERKHAVLRGYFDPRIYIYMYK
jgi:hypothetical protein